MAEEVNLRGDDASRESDPVDPGRQSAVADASGGDRKIGGCSPPPGAAVRTTTSTPRRSAVCAAAICGRPPRVRENEGAGGEGSRPSTIAAPVSSKRAVGARRPRSVYLSTAQPSRRRRGRVPSCDRAPAPRWGGASCPRGDRRRGTPPVGVSGGDGSWRDHDDGLAELVNGAARNASNSRLDLVSRLPVGSSAKTTAGRVTSARAAATRCCCPPESSAGRCRDGPRGRARRANRRSTPVRAATGQGSGIMMFSRRTQRGQQVERLEDEPDPVPAQPGELPFTEAGQVGARRGGPRRSRSVQPGQAMQQRGLARTRRAHHRREPAPARIPPTRRPVRSSRRAHARTSW